MPPESDVTLAQEQEQEQDAVPSTAVADLAEWLDATVTRHPALLAAQAQVDAAEAKVRSVRTQGLPSIDFTGNYYRNGYPNQRLQPTRSTTTTVGVALNIPLFAGFARTCQVRGAQAQADPWLQLASTVVKDHAEAVAARQAIPGCRHPLVISPACRLDCGIRHGLSLRRFELMKSLRLA